VVEARRERKVVTVLFADLVGFTARSEQLDPEDVADELGRYHARVREELERYGGTVEKFIGDAAMAIFGAPVAHEDDPERAVRAAFAIREWALDEGIDVRVGINTGEALVTVDARPEAGETMAAGDVVNTAARLQSAAPVNGILVGEQTYRATQRAIDYGEATSVEAKGKTAPVQTWEAMQARARIGVDRVHGAALVGRTREVALLEDALARTLDERSPQLVTLVGVPGIGKSRLVLELYDAVERHAELISWRHGRCLPYGDGVTFWALGEMVKAQAGILEGDDEADAERKLREVVADPWVESHLRPLVGLGGGAEAQGDARSEAFTAWRRFFEGLADERPLVLVFEDLHWADDNLLDFVDHLVDWATGVPLLVVSTARPELLTRRPGWGGGKPNALTISLSPLSDDDTARLLHALLGTLLPAETQAELLGRAGGNPLYAEEFARMLRDRGGAGEIPETVQGLIAARLDLLEPDQKALLQDAAVVGKRFWSGALASLDGADASALDVRLHELERKEFVRRERSSGVAGEHEYAFRHLLVRDVAYGQIPRPERARKHLAAARWIERLGRREDHAEMLAHHYLQALELTRAAGRSADDFADAAHDALTDAGDRAVALHALEPALRFFRAAFELLPEGDGRRGRLLLRIGRAYHARGETPLEVLGRAREELIAAGDVEGAAEAETILCNNAWLAGDGDAALAHLEQARRLVEPLGVSEAKARVIGVGSQMAMLQAKNNLAVELGEQGLAMAEELGLDAIKASVLINVGNARVDLGDHDAGLELLERGTEAARQANVPFEIVRGLGNQASALWSIGRLDGPPALWRQALAESDQYGQTGFSRWFRGVGIGAEIDLGRWDDALSRADAFIAEIEGGSPHYLAGECYRARALIRFARGDERGAVADAEQSLELARRATDPQAHFPGQATAAHVFAELGDRDRAAATVVDFARAVEAGQRLGYAVSTVYMLAWVVGEVGDGPRLADALERHYDTMWAKAGAAYGRGDPTAAAGLLAAAGAVAPAAYCRLVAARRGDLRQLEPALAFYRSVGAGRYVSEGESLLATTTRSA
jgi:class 3 adenylate cyclase/tetratricopeptide (TPR) repeat protein